MQHNKLKQEFDLSYYGHTQWSYCLHDWLPLFHIGTVPLQSEYHSYTIISKVVSFSKLWFIVLEFTKINTNNFQSVQEIILEMWILQDLFTPGFCP